MPKQNEIIFEFMAMSFSSSQQPLESEELNVFINFNYHLKFLSLIFTSAKTESCLWLRLNVYLSLSTPKITKHYHKLNSRSFNVFWWLQLFGMLRQSYYICIFKRITKFTCRLHCLMRLCFRHFVQMHTMLLLHWILVENRIGIETERGRENSKRPKSSTSSCFREMSVVSLLITHKQKHEREIYWIFTIIWLIRHETFFVAVK